MRTLAIVLAALTVLLPEAEAQLIGNPTGAFAPIHRGPVEGPAAVRPFIGLEYAFFDRDVELDDEWSGLSDVVPLRSHFGLVKAGVHVPYFEFFGKIGGATMEFPRGSYDETGWGVGLGARGFFGTPAGRFGLFSQLFYYETDGPSGLEVDIVTVDLFAGYAYPIPLGGDAVVLPYVGFGGSFVDGTATARRVVVLPPFGPIATQAEFDIDADGPATLLFGLDLHPTSAFSIQVEGRIHGDGASLGVGIGWAF